jgi:hypothetical protein
VNAWRQGIAFARPLHLRDAFVEAPGGREEVRVPHARERVTGAQLQPRRKHLSAVMATLQIQVVRRRVGARRSHHPLFSSSQQRYAQRGHDRLRDLVLDGEDVRGGPVESLGPEVAARLTRQSAAR